LPKIDKKIFRILDANFNRAKEGLRVCEDIVRFSFNSVKLSEGLKNLRHNITDSLKLLNIKLANLLSERDASKDVGRKSFRVELKRKNISDIFTANLQRAKESVRVLEEFSKLINQKAAVNFKEIRYKIYQLEKEASKKFSSLSHLR
jgi:thiamine-phosphate pyrophosphorylase